MKVQSAAINEDMGKRLRRIEGQVRGIQKMLEDDRECHEIVQQMSAIRAAVHKATLFYLRGYARDCLGQAHEVPGSEREAMVDDLLNLIGKIG